MKTLEQRASEAVKESLQELDFYPPKTGFAVEDILKEIILRHFSDYQGANEKLREAVEKIVSDEHCDNDGRGCPVIDELKEALSQPADESRKELVEALKRIERGESECPGLEPHFYGHASAIASAALRKAGEL